MFGCEDAYEDDFEYGDYDIVGSHTARSVESLGSSQLGNAHGIHEKKGISNAATAGGFFSQANTFATSSPAVSAVRGDSFCSYRSSTSGASSPTPLRQGGEFQKDPDAVGMDTDAASVASRSHSSVLPVSFSGQGLADRSFASLSRASTLSDARGGPGGGGGSRKGGELGRAGSGVLEAGGPSLAPVRQVSKLPLARQVAPSYFSPADRSGIMHQTNVTTVRVLEAEGGGRHAGCAPLQGHPVSTDVTSTDTSCEASPMKQPPAQREVQQQQDSVLKETSSTTSASLSSSVGLSRNNRLPIVHPVEQSTEHTGKNIFDVLPAAPLSRSSRGSKESKREDFSFASSRESSVCIIPSPRKRDDSAIHKGSTTNQEQQTCINDYTHVGARAPIISHVVHDTDDVRSNSDPLSSKTIWKQYQAHSSQQSLSELSPAAFRTGSHEQLEHRISSDCSRYTSSASQSKNLSANRDALMGTILALKNEIMSWNERIKEKEDEISRLDQIPASDVAAGGNKAAKNNAHECFSIFPKRARGGKNHAGKGTSGNPSLLSNLAKLRAVNAILERKYEQVKGSEITVRGLVSKVTSRLERIKERFKELQLLKRELENRDKRAAHMIEELHRRMPSREEIRNRQVNESLYSHASLERKIELLRGEIRMKEGSRNMMLAKCKEIEAELTKRNCVRGVTRKEIDSLRAVYEKNKQKIEQLHAAIAIYRGTTNQRRENSGLSEAEAQVPLGSRAGSQRLHSAATGSQRSIKSKEATEDSALIVECDTLKRRRQELEGEVETLQARIRQRCSQIEANTLYEVRLRNNDRPALSGRKMSSSSSVNVDHKKAQQLQSQQQHSNGSDNSPNSVHSGTLSTSCRRTPLKPTQRGTNRFLPQTEGESQERILGLDSSLHGQKPHRGTDCGRNDEVDPMLSRRDAGSTLPPGYFFKAQDTVDKVLDLVENDSCHSPQSRAEVPVMESSTWVDRARDTPENRMPRVKEKPSKGHAVASHHQHQQQESGAKMVGQDHLEKKNRGRNVVRSRSTSLECNSSHDKYNEKKIDNAEREVAGKRSPKTSGRSTPLWLRD